MAKAKALPRFVNLSNGTVTVFDETKRNVRVHPWANRDIRPGNYVVEGAHYQKFVSGRGPLHPFPADGSVEGIPILDSMGKRVEAKPAPRRAAPPPPAPKDDPAADDASDQDDVEGGEEDQGEAEGEAGDSDEDSGDEGGGESDAEDSGDESSDEVEKKPGILGRVLGRGKKAAKKKPAKKKKGG